MELNLWRSNSQVLYGGLFFNRGNRPLTVAIAGVSAYKHEPKYFLVAGWSSPVARQAHNLKVRGSNPLPATKGNKPAAVFGRFCMMYYRIAFYGRLAQR
jgi:hypothetical protein